MTAALTYIEVVFAVEHDEDVTDDELHAAFDDVTFGGTTLVADDNGRTRAQVDSVHTVWVRGVTP